jgi:hypothetical protein
MWTFVVQEGEGCEELLRRCTAADGLNEVTSQLFHETIYFTGGRKLLKYRLKGEGVDGVADGHQLPPHW